MKPSHPGETLRWLLLEDGILVDDAAEQAGLTSSQLRDLIAGTLNVDAEIAGCLSKLGGIPAQTWLKLQADFDAC